MGGLALEWKVAQGTFQVGNLIFHPQLDHREKRLGGETRPGRRWARTVINRHAPKDTQPPRGMAEDNSPRYSDAEEAERTSAIWGLLKDLNMKWNGRRSSGCLGRPALTREEQSRRWQVGSGGGETPGECPPKCGGHPTVAGPGARGPGGVPGT